MSGGVDSSVSACLLAEQGYEVLGSHMKLVHLDGVDHGCCGPRAEADAEAVARVGGFDFEIADMSERFERTVLADFFSEHEAGRTPNPCVRCNERIKFGAFLDRADELGIDLVATGHYVRTEHVTGRRKLLRGADRAKDQSYVLHMLGPRELLGRCGLEADRVSWVAGAPPEDGPFEAEVKVRSNGEDAPAVVDPQPDGTVAVEFSTPQRGIAPGQSVAVYRGDELLGGG